MAYIAGIPIRDSIHTDFSTGISTWAAYRSVLTGEFVSGGGALSGRYGEFTKDIQEYNRKADTLTGAWGDRNDTGMFLRPFNAGFRYTGTGDFVTYSREIDPLDLNPYLYFLGSEGVTTAGGAVSSWSQVSAGSNQLSRTLAQGTASLQPDNITLTAIDFDGTADKLAFDVAVAQAGILITATSNGIFAFEVNSDSVDEITALGFETGYFRDLDLFGYALLPTTATDSQIASVIKYFSENTSATKNPTGSLTYYWWFRADLLTPKFDALDFSGVTSISGFRFTGLTSFPSISWDSVGAWGFAYAFWGCSDLVSIGTPTGDTSGPQYYVNAFSGCSSLTSMPFIDTSKALQFNSTWSSCSSLTSFPALDMSSATSFNSTWYQCTSLASFPTLTFSTAADDDIDFTGAWRSCTALTAFPALNLSRGTDFDSAWRLNTAMTSFGACTFSTHADDDIDFKSAWLGNTSFTSFPTLDLSRGTNFESTWYGCSNMLEFPSGTTFSTTVTDDINFTEAWWGCRAFTTFPALDLSRGTDFEAAWNGCVAMTSFNATGLDSGTIFKNAWNDCTALASFPALDLSAGTNFFAAWYECQSMTSFLATDLSGGA